MPPPPSSNRRSSTPSPQPTGLQGSSGPDLSRDLDHDGNIDAGDDRINDLNHDGRIDAQDDPSLDLNHDGRIDGDDSPSRDLNHDGDIDATDEALEVEAEEQAVKPDSVGSSLGWSKSSSNNWTRPESQSVKVEGPKQGLR